MFTSLNIQKIGILMEAYQEVKNLYKNSLQELGR